MEEKRSSRSRGQRRSGSVSLTQYRLYFLHGIDNLISYSHEFQAEDNQRAIRIAEGWREGRLAELWTGAQKLKAWEADR